MFSGSSSACDVLIIGNGAAGLSLALRLADHLQITVLSKGAVNDGSTFYAQGGIAAIFDESDNIESHVTDTLIAGDGLCDRHTVSFIISNARHCVQWLIDNGMHFDQRPSKSNTRFFHLTREGGHSHRRILHYADETGSAVENMLVNQALRHPNIRLLEYCNAIDLITTDSDKTVLSQHRHAVSAYIWNRKNKKVETCSAPVVVLAIGGAAKVYQYNTNPDVASGDGVAMAWRAGCRMANLEFNQFYPTSLFHPDAHNFLVNGSTSRRRSTAQVPRWLPVYA